MNVFRGLLQNPKGSDRGIARKINVSQPTVSRTRYRLEEQGIIQSYEIIPDLKALGYEIIACGISRSGDLPKDNRVIFAWPVAAGIGIFSISVHKDYHDYAQFASMHEIQDETLLTVLSGPAKPLSFRDIPFTLKGE